MFDIFDCHMQKQSVCHLVSYMKSDFLSQMEQKDLI